MTRVVQRPPAERVPASRQSANGPSSTSILIGALAVGIVLPVASVAFGMYDHVQHWGKFIHAVDAACVTLAFGLLFIAWRERGHIFLSDELSGLLMMFVGVLFGVCWEVAQFMIDWVLDSDLQKSNTDTMTDLLCNHVGAALAALVAVRLYCHATTAADRDHLGGVAEWLVGGPSRLLDRHGFALMTIVACIIATAVALLWFAGRPAPGLPIPPL